MLIAICTVGQRKMAMANIFFRFSSDMGIKNFTFNMLSNLKRQTVSRKTAKIPWILFQSFVRYLQTEAHLKNTDYLNRCVKTWTNRKPCKLWNGWVISFHTSYITRYLLIDAGFKVNLSQRAIGAAACRCNRNYRYLWSNQLMFSSPVCRPTRIHWVLSIRPE